MTLLVTAAPKESWAVARGLGVELEPSSPRLRAAAPWQVLRLTPVFELLETGIGKVNAAAAVARCIDRGRHGRVINLGVCGLLPAPLGVPSALGLGSTVLGEESIYADEGLVTPDGFIGCAAMGFPLGPFDAVDDVGLPGARLGGCRADPALLTLLRPLAEAVGPIATVSTCSGTDAAARQTAERTGAAVEAMEGAAIAHALSRIRPGPAETPIPFAELRVISNTAGDRGRQRWDLSRALEILGRVAERLAALPGLGKQA